MQKSKIQRDFILVLYTNKTFSINEPGIMFIGLIQQSLIPMIIFERQAIIAKQYINGEITLPTKQEMNNDLEGELKFNEDIGHSKSKFFISNIMGYSFVKFNEELCKMTTQKVDTDNISPSLQRYVQEFYKLLAQGNSFDIKSIDFDTVFRGFEFNLTSEFF